MKFHTDDSLEKFRRHFGIDKLTDTDFEELKLNTISALKQYSTDTGSDVVALEFIEGNLHIAKLKTCWIIYIMKGTSVMMGTSTMAIVLH